MTKQGLTTGSEIDMCSFKVVLIIAGHNRPELTVSIRRLFQMLPRSTTIQYLLF